MLPGGRSRDFGHPPRGGAEAPGARVGAKSLQLAVLYGRSVCGGILHRLRVRQTVGTCQVNKQGNTTPPWQKVRQPKSPLHFPLHARCVLCRLLPTSHRMTCLYI